MHVNVQMMSTIMTSRLSRLAAYALLALGLNGVPALPLSALVVKPVQALGEPATSFAAVLDLSANSKVGVLRRGPIASTSASCRSTKSRAGESGGPTHACTR